MLLSVVYYARPWRSAKQPHCSLLSFPSTPVSQPYRFKVHLSMVLRKYRHRPSLIFALLVLSAQSIAFMFYTPLTRCGSEYPPFSTEWLRIMLTRRASSAASPSLHNRGRRSGVQYPSPNFNHTGFTLSRANAQLGHLEDIAVRPQIIAVSTVLLGLLAAVHQNHTY